MAVASAPQEQDLDWEEAMKGFPSTSGLTYRHPPRTELQEKDLDWEEALKGFPSRLGLASQHHPIASNALCLLTYDEIRRSEPKESPVHALNKSDLVEDADPARQRKLL